MCLNAISRSDLIFAWIDDLTGYGTLTEIGYAKGLGKLILIATPEPPDQHSIPDWYPGVPGSIQPQPSSLDELWFAFTLATQVVACDNPAKFILSLAADIAAAGAARNLPDTATPIERQFWGAHQQLRLPELDGLVFQHPMTRYRIDFALPARKIGIELDGFASHSSTADIARDRNRQRALESFGWYIIRFGGSEVHHDAESCVRQAASLIRSRRSMP